MKRYRGHIKFLGDRYTFWTCANTKTDAFYNLCHKLGKETGYSTNFIIEATPVWMWEIGEVPVKKQKTKEFEWKEVSANWFSATKVNGKISKEETKIIDDDGNVFIIKHAGIVLLQDRIGVSDNEKDNRVDDRRTGLQSCLDEIIRLAQIARG
jgi:hypothetical protein